MSLGDEQTMYYITLLTMDGNTMEDITVNFYINYGIHKHIPME